MFEYSYFYTYLEQYQRALQLQEKQLRQMRKELDALKKSLDEVKKIKPVNIEKVEYRFDQLKVETLEGVLNIGFNPLESANEAGEVTLGGKAEDEVLDELLPPQKNVYANIRSRMYQFLREEAPKEIQSFEQTYGIVLGDTYREQMVTDLEKQVDKRIGYYLGQRTLTSDNQYQIEQEVYEKTKADVLQALEKHIKQLKGEA